MHESLSDRIAKHRTELCKHALAVELHRRALAVLPGPAAEPTPAAPSPSQPAAAVALPLLYLPGSSTEPAAGDDPWACYRFLIGEWAGEGSGQPGQGKGAFSLAPDLQGKILLRKNHAEYPASGDRPAAAHDGVELPLGRVQVSDPAVGWAAVGQAAHAGRAAGDGRDLPAAGT